MNLLKELLALGFTPTTALTITGLAIVWWRMESKDRSNGKTREAWHEETRAEVAELRGHVEACNEDRETLKDESATLNATVATLQERVTRMSACPSKRCPLRLPP